MLNLSRDVSCVSRGTGWSALILVLMTMFLSAEATAARADKNIIWNSLRQSHFGDRAIKDGAGVIGLEAPKRAEDSAIVPITIKDLLPPDSEVRIDKVWLVIDNNPVPMSAIFEFGPIAASADIATRVRVNAYTHMRIIAETDERKLYMATRYVKASGGCSAPATKDPSAALAHLGEIRLQDYDEAAPIGALREVQIMVRHPNHTGLQMNQLTRVYTPAHYVKQISVDYAGQAVLNMETTFSLSEDPSLHFSFRPKKPGELSVLVVDTKENRFTSSMKLRPAADELASIVDSSINTH